MRSLTLSKGGFNKLRSHIKELKSTDLEDSIKSIPPGEWAVLNSSGSETSWIAFINPLIQEKYSSIQVLTTLPNSKVSSFSVETFLKNLIKTAIEKRFGWKDYSDGSRTVYGSSDGLPGLIVDTFVNANVIQINTAGLDKHRELIKVTVEESTKRRAYFLDNAKYREKESLPVFTNEPIPSLQVRENNLEYHLRQEIIQKVGFYYDHRENRIQLEAILNRLNQKPNSGLDLFSYAGAWGLNALKAGTKEMLFVDQGDFETEIAAALKLNKFEGKGSFLRQDVFKFLDTASGQSKKYDLILCDPPAFAKSALQKPQALEGYSKLHRKVFKLSAPGALVSFSSCTHYVSHAEFQKNILEAANKEGRKIQLIYSGIQGWDHPVTSLEDRSNYIKCYFYFVE